MSIVYRGQLTTLWVILQSNEQLGLLDSDYLEDYFGNDGQLTLHHVESNTDYPVLMIEQVTDTPIIPHDVFRGQVSLAGLPSGTFQVRGRCRDRAGNYTVVSAVQSPIGDEQVVSLWFQLAGGDRPQHQIVVAVGLIRLGITGLSLKKKHITPAAIHRPKIDISRLAKKNIAALR